MSEAFARNVSEIVLVRVSYADMLELYAGEKTGAVRGCPVQWAMDDVGKIYVWPLPTGMPCPWRPIAEAPRDGTMVDLWGCVGRNSEAGRWAGCWWENGDWQGSWLPGLRIKPTHFMPLPAGPSSLRLDPYK